MSWGDWARTFWIVSTINDAADGKARRPTWRERAASAPPDPDPRSTWEYAGGCLIGFAVVCAVAIPIGNSVIGGIADLFLLILAFAVVTNWVQRRSKRRVHARTEGIRRDDEQRRLLAEGPGVAGISPLPTTPKATTQLPDPLMDSADTPIARPAVSTTSTEAGERIVARLRDLYTLRAEGVITYDEYSQKHAELLKDL
jgi:hypothetical protein